MSIQFPSNPVLDMAILAGIDPSDKYLQEKISTIPELQGKTEEVALFTLKQAYTSYKADLSKRLTYDDFVEKVEANLAQLGKVPIQVKVAVAEKVDSLARQRIGEEKTRYSWITRFFHKLGQVFKGHGFRTEGEWGRELAARILLNNYEAYKSQLDKCFAQSLDAKAKVTNSQEIIKRLQEATNALPESQFTKFINDVFFQKKEVLRGEKDKLVFYQNLNPEKKRLFESELLRRDDWFKQAVDIIEGAESFELKEETENKEIYNFVTEDMVKKFQQDPDRVIAHRADEGHNHWLKTFFSILFDKAIKDYLNRNETNKIQDLIKKKRDFSIEQLHTSQVLDTEDLNQLKAMQLK